MSDLISRQDALDILDEYSEMIAEGLLGYYATARKEMCDLPSANEESFEWCHDCAEYDKEKHCCHRFTKVIRNTVEEIKNNQRIPCEQFLPNNYEDVLLCIRDMRKGCENDYYFISAHVIDGDWEPTLNIMDDTYGMEPVAWMPLPKPYKESEQND